MELQEFDDDDPVTEETKQKIKITKVAVEETKAIERELYANPFDPET